MNASPRLVTCVALLSPLLLFAQTAPAPSTDDSSETIVLSAFEVKTSRDSGYRVQNSVATTGIAQELIKTPLPITVVTEEFLKDADLSGFMGSLRYVSSIAFDPHTADGNNSPGFGQANGQPNLTTFRGQPYNGTFRNGLRLAYGYYTENVDRIEVAKGPMAVFVGGATLGGEVNLVSKKPQFSRFNEASVRFASHETYDLALDSTGPLSRTLAYRLIVNHHDGNTWRDYSHRQTTFIEPQLLWRPFERLSTRLDLVSRVSKGNLVSQNTSSTKNYQSAFDNPPQYLLDLGTASLGRPFTADEYRARVGQGFGTWRQDMFNATGRWVSLGEGEGLIEGNAPDGRRYNYYGPHATFTDDTSLIESETTLSATDWFEMHVLGRYTHAREVQPYYWFGTRVFPAGNTPIGGGNSYRFKDDSLTAKVETLFKKQFWRLNGTLLAGAQFGQQWTSATTGAWDFSKLPSVAGSPNVFNSPATLTGASIFTFFDPRVHSFPDTTLAQRWADEVLPAGAASRATTRQMPLAGYTAASLGIWDDRVILTGGARRGGTRTVTETRDRNDDIVYSSSGAPQINVVPRQLLNSWMYGAVVKVVEGVNLYASYNYGQNAPSAATGGTSLVGWLAFSDAPSSIVTAQEQAANPAPNVSGKGKEVGAKFELFNRKLTGSIGWFSLVRGGILAVDTTRTQNDPRNVGTELDPNPATFNGSVRARVQWAMPIDGNMTEGFETDWVWTPNKNYSVVLAGSHLTKNKMTVVKPPTNNPALMMSYLILNGRPLDNAPDDTVRVFQRYVFTDGNLKGLSAGLGVRYQSWVMPSASNASWGIAFPSFYVADITLGYATKIRGYKTDFLLAVTNATNRTYFEGGRVFGAPREFALTTRVSF